MSASRAILFCPAVNSEILDYFFPQILAETEIVTSIIVNGPE